MPEVERVAEALVDPVESAADGVAGEASPREARVKAAPCVKLCRRVLYG